MISLEVPGSVKPTQSMNNLHTSLNKPGPERHKRKPCLFILLTFLVKHGWHLYKFIHFI